MTKLISNFTVLECSFTQTPTVQAVASSRLVALQSQPTWDAMGWQTAPMRCHGHAALTQTHIAELVH